MKKILLCALAFTLIGAAPPPPVPSPNEIVAAAAAGEWVLIAPSDLLVMDLAADPKGRARRVVIQLMPPPVAQGWVGNIRKLVSARWYDGTSINRAQDNYVVQWGDATAKKMLPDGLAVVPETEYAWQRKLHQSVGPHGGVDYSVDPEIKETSQLPGQARLQGYSGEYMGHFGGWPWAVGRYGDARAWPVHCYGMVGVGRNLSPDTGSGAELYTVIGHAPHHLDRNIALVGRVIEGIEYLSSLPRGTEALGFYKTPEERTTISSIRIGTDIADLPRFEYLSTESASFAQYANARANRRDPFFIKPAGGADICNIPVPVRRIK